MNLTLGDPPRELYAGTLVDAFYVNNIATDLSDHVTSRKEAHAHAII